MLRFGFCGSFLNFLRINGTAIFQSMQLGTRSSLFTLCSQFTGLMGFMTILRFIFPKTPQLYQFAYPATNLWNIIMILFFGYTPLKEFLKLLKESRFPDSPQISHSKKSVQAENSIQADQYEDIFQTGPPV